MVFIPTYLYIKQHSITGKLYFGKTCKNPLKYKGSGKHWKLHINQHGNEYITTLWYHLYDNIFDLVADALSKKGVKYSPEKEKEIIGMIGDELEAMGMNAKEIRYQMSYDEDFISDTLGGLERESDNEEGMENEEPTPEKPNMREVAEVVKSFYDASTGKFPKGETGVITHIKKQFGDHAAQVAEQFVEQLAARGQQLEQQQMAAQQFEEIKRLAGLTK